MDYKKYNSDEDIAGPIEELYEELRREKCYRCDCLEWVDNDTMSIKYHEKSKKHNDFIKMLLNML